MKAIFHRTAAALLLLTAGLQASALSISLPKMTYTARLGYNIGGTAPIGMPASIRSMNKYYLQSNFTLGLDVQKDIWGKWGLLTGLRIESKDMKIDATVKNYHMEMVQGGESIEGRYTGNLVTECEEVMLTLPVQATFHPTEKVIIKAGPYVSYVKTREFKGYVYDGYLREGDPTGPKVEMGNTEDSRATFDFGEHMRKLQYGIDVGVDWNFHKRWGVYADLTWGLNGIHHSDFKTIEQTLYPIFGTFGVSYKLK